MSRDEQYARLARSIAQYASVMADIKDHAQPPPEHSQADPNLYPSFEALKITLDFLDNFADLRGPGHGLGPTKPLWDLLVALGDLERGVTPPMLRTKQTGKRGESTHYSATKAWAAIAMDTFMQAGSTQAEAAEKVANQLNAVKTSNGAHRNAVTPATVTEWRDQLNRSVGAERAQMTWDSYKQKRAAGEGSADPAVWAEWAAKTLRELAQSPTFRISP